MLYEHDFKCVTTAIQCTFKRTLIYVHTTFQKILIAIFRQGGTLIFPYHDKQTEPPLRGGLGRKRKHFRPMFSFYMTICRKYY